jgi:hypothetical protein
LAAGGGIFVKLTRSTLRGQERGTHLAGWKPFEERRFRLLELSLGFLEMVLAGTPAATSDAPADLRVIISFNHWDNYRSVILLIASAAFASLEFGEEIPKARIIFTRETGKSRPLDEGAQTGTLENCSPPSASRNTTL